jgi:hypothetical protein
MDHGMEQPDPTLTEKYACYFAHSSSTILDDPGQYLRAREGERELGTLAIGKRCQERISATGWAW